MRTLTLQLGETVQVRIGETVRIQNFILELSSGGRDHIAWADVKLVLDFLDLGTLIAPIDRVFHSRQKDGIYRGAQQAIDEEFMIGGVAINVLGAGRSHYILVKIRSANGEYAH